MKSCTLVKKTDGPFFLFPFVKSARKPNCCLQLWSLCFAPLCTAHAVPCFDFLNETVIHKRNRAICIRFIVHPILLSSERFSAREILGHKMNDCITFTKRVMAHALEKNDSFAMGASIVSFSQSGALKPPDSNIVASKADLS